MNRAVIRVPIATTDETGPFATRHTGEKVLIALPVRIGGVLLRGHQVWQQHVGVRGVGEAMTQERGIRLQKGWQKVARR